jgi:hypothetical protein
MAESDETLVAGERDLVDGALNILVAANIEVDVEG